MHDDLCHLAALRPAAALMLTLGLGLSLVATPVLADDAGTAASSGTAEPGVIQRVEGAITRGVKAAASGVERGAKAAAHGVEVGAKAAASGVQRGLKAAAHGVEVGAKATAEVAGSVASKVGSGAASK
ncbi:MAG: hypothetical protein RLZZ584_2892 [Pseudomonadota bacterium]